MQRGIFVDCFAGGGGASLGIKWALGRSPEVAINHDEHAIAIYRANHPEAELYISDVWKMKPLAVTRGRKVWGAWFSPDCTEFSKAKGSKPVRKKVRLLAWEVNRWARTVKPDVIFLENVEEFVDWGPLLPNRKPDPKRKGLHFRRWLGAIRGAGYNVEYRELRADDYGTPSRRKRFFLIARRDGKPIRWPSPTHGPGLQPYRVAAEAMDFSLRCPSIFERKKKLCAKTLARIARGIHRFVLNAAKPFLIPVTHAGDQRAYSLDEPLRTITGAHRGEFAMIAPTLIQTGYGERKGQAPRSLDLFEPLGTIVAGGTKHAMVTAFLAKNYGGHESSGTPLDAPISTLTTQDHHALVSSHLVKLYGTCRDGSPMTQPMPTVTAKGWHLAEVRALLLKYSENKNARSKQLSLLDDDRFIVRVHGGEYMIADIGFRMLSPRELFNSHRFPPTYKIDPLVPCKRTKKRRVLKPLNVTAQVSAAGNSVPPDLSFALVFANRDGYQISEAA